MSPPVFIKIGVQPQALHPIADGSLTCRYVVPNAAAVGPLYVQQQVGPSGDSRCLYACPRDAVPGLAERRGAFVSSSCLLAQQSRSCCYCLFAMSDGAILRFEVMSNRYQDSAVLVSGGGMGRGPGGLGGLDADLDGEINSDGRDTERRKVPVLMHECRKHGTVLVVDEDLEVWMISGVSGPAGRMRARPVSLSLDRPPISIVDGGVEGTLIISFVDGSVSDYEIVSDARAGAPPAREEAGAGARALTLRQKSSRRFPLASSAVCAAAVAGDVITLARVDGQVQRYLFSTGEPVSSGPLDELSRDAPCLAAILPRGERGTLFVSRDGDLYVEPEPPGPLARIPGLPGVAIRGAVIPRLESTLCLCMAREWGLVAVLDGSGEFL